MTKPDPPTNPPLQAPSLGAPPQRDPPIRLSGRKWLGGMVACLGLSFGAIVINGLRAPFHVEGLRSQSLGRTCRVAFTARNPRNQSIDAQALILVYESVITGAPDTVMVPTGFTRHRIRLPAHGAQLVTVDVADPKTSTGCRYVEVKPLRLHQ